MDFELNEQQAMLKESVTRLLSERYNFEARRSLRKETLGWGRANWQYFADLGLLGVGIAEEHGGTGGDAIDAAIIAEAFGAHLVAEPYLATVVVGGTILPNTTSPIAKDVLAKIVAGNAIVGCGLEGLFARKRIAARRNGEEWLLHGMCANVVHGDGVDWLIVVADAGGATGLFLVDTAASGISCRAYGTFDALRAADISFSDTPATILAIGNEADWLGERGYQAGIGFVAAEAVGIMRSLLEMTVEHLKMRQQFGQPLARFQALRHKAVDMLIALEQAQSMTLYAATMLGSRDETERRKALAAVKVVVGEAARSVGQTAVQLHGGMGVADEHKVGWGMRRLTMIEMQFGDTDRHAEVLAALDGFTVPAA